MSCRNSPASQRPGASTVTPGAEAEGVPPTLALERLKEVRDLCRNQAENGSFPTLAALIAGFSLSVLPTLKYDAKYYDVQDNYTLSVLLETATEGCDPCTWINQPNHTVLAYTQAILLGLTGILSAVSMIGFFLVNWKGWKILSSFTYLVEEEGSRTWKEIAKADSLDHWNPPSEIYIIKKQIHNFLIFWARWEDALTILRGLFWFSLVTLMLSSAVSPHLYCFSCNLGIFISSLMVFGCFMILVIVVLLPVFNGTTKAHAEFGCARPRVSAAQSSSGTVAGAGK